MYVLRYNACRLFIGILFSAIILARNPFAFDNPLPEVIAVGYIEPKHKAFALLSYDNSCYQVKVGDKIHDFKVVAIEKNVISLYDTKHKKALQLKIS